MRSLRLKSYHNLTRFLAILSAVLLVNCNVHLLMAQAEAGVQGVAQDQDNEAAKILAEQLLLNQTSNNGSTHSAISPAVVSGRSVNNGFEEKQKKLVAEEEELLRQLSQGGTNTQPSEAQVVAPAVTSPQAEEGKAAINVDQAVEQAVTPKREIPKEENGIEIVKPAPEHKEAVRAVSLTEKTQREMEARLENQSKSLSTLQNSNLELKRQAEAAQRRSGSMAQELEETRNRLIIAETEVERLSKVIEDLNKHNLNRLTGQPVQALVRQPVRSRPAPVVQAVQAPSSAADDMPIATVVAEKAYLRTGPGKDNSPLMTVPQGTRLAVETRNGEWYRVVAPTGIRAWVAADVVAFGRDPQSGPTRTIGVKGFDSSLEEEAVNLIQQGK